MVTLEHLDRKLDRYSVGNYQLAPREFSIHVKLHVSETIFFKIIKIFKKEITQHLIQII